MAKMAAADHLDEPKINGLARPDGQQSLAATMLLLITRVNLPFWAENFH
jgi:hypothetical protein